AIPRRAGRQRLHRRLQGQAGRGELAGPHRGGSRSQGHPAEIEARKSAAAIVIAEQGRWYTAIVRPLLAAPVIIYLWKVIVWDIVLGLGSTDPIGGDVGAWAGMIVTAYVGGRSLEKIASTIWRRR
ncbi:MAG: hypothetical protein ACM3JD_13450, partial [Rudaea sp.]